MSTWSICIAERALPMGPLDNLILRKDASHAFIRIKNEHDETIMEIHGCSQVITGKHARLKHTLLLSYAFIADNLLGRPAKHGPLLHVKVITQKEQMEALANGRLSDEREKYFGSAEDIMRRVECALEAARAINKANIRYVFFTFGQHGGINCQSVMAEMRDRMFGQNPEPSTKYATPGLGQDLEPYVPGLSHIKPNLTKSLNQVMKTIKDLVPTVDTDPTPALGWLSSFSVATSKLQPI